jgi:hypothetical protein
MKKIEIKDYILIGLLIMLLIILFIVVEKSNKTSINNQDTINYSEVSNASTFLTIELCANRYIDSLGTSSVSDLMKLLDEQYKEDNFITEDNVLDRLDQISGNYNFNAKKILQESLDNNYIRYYVYGLLRQDIINEYDYGTDYYLIITVNQDDYLYSVLPYDGAIFKEE